MSLPTEVFGLFVEHIDSSSDLLALMRCSRFTFFEGERVLYRQVRTPKTYQDPTLDGMLDGLIDNPSRSRLIRVFMLENVSMVLSVAYKLKAALRLMVNLKYLTLLPEKLPFTTVFDPDPLELARFPFKLVRFRYAGNKPDALPEFFASQPSIRHLRVGYYHLTDRLPLTTLPDLESLHGAAHLVNVFMLASRSPTRLCWTTTGNELFTEHRHGPPHLKLLALRLPSQGPEDFKLPILAPNLQYLEYTSNCQHRDKDLISIRGLLKLRVIQLIDCTRSHVRWKQESAEQYFEQLFDSFPNLQVARLGAWEQRKGRKPDVHDTDVIPEDLWIEEPLERV